MPAATGTRTKIRGNGIGAPSEAGGGRIDFEAVNQAALDRLEELCEELLPGGRVVGCEYVVGDLAGNPGKSCKINLDTGKWSDFATKEGGGDVTSLVAAIRGCSQREAACWLADRLAIQPDAGGRSVKRPPKPRDEEAEEIVLPAPCQPKDITHPRRGRPSAIWTYCDENGDVLGVVCRFDKDEAGRKGRPKKEIAPYTFWRDNNTGKGRWRWKTWPDPKPLYGLDRLAKAPNLPVLIVEGEKTADAAQRLLPRAVCMTWPGGSNAVGKADWSPLKGRRVAVWPDADEPGRRAAEEVTRCALAAGATKVFIVEPPADVPAGWDLADAASEGWTSRKVSEWIQTHRRPAQATVKVEPALPKEEEIDLALPEWPKLDPKALHGVAGEFVALATENSEADPAAVLATFLVRFGVEVGSGPYFRVGDSTHHARLASVIVGASSKARKGTSAKPVTRLFEYGAVSGEEISPARTTPGPFSSGEGIIHAVRDPVLVWDERDETEKIKDPGVTDKRLFIVDEEFSGALACTRREGNTLSVIIRTAWDSGNLDPLTKHSKQRATGAHIGWVSHITLRELQARLAESEAFNGFANRILWVCSRRPKLVPIPRPMPDERLVPIQHHIIDVVRRFRDPTEIRFDPQAETAWIDEYYENLTIEHPGLAGCVINRAEAQVIRLAMIYAILAGLAVITLDVLEAAIAFWSYCRQSALYIFHGRETDTVAQTILEALAAGPLFTTDLYNAMSLT